MTGRRRREEPLTLAEVAEQLGVHYMTVYRYVRTARLPAHRDGGRWRVESSALAQLLPPARPGRGGASTAQRAPQLARALVAGDDQGAWRLVEDALVGGLSGRDVILRLVAPAMEEIGDRWERGELDVGDEHVATALVLRMLGRLAPACRPPGRRRGVVVVGAPPGERHGLACHLFAEILRSHGYEVRDLGADTPAEAFVSSVEASGERVVVALSITTSGSDAAAPAVIRALRAARPELPIIAGGRAVQHADRARALGADGTATAATAAAAIEVLLQAPRDEDASLIVEVVAGRARPLDNRSTCCSAAGRVPRRRMGHACRTGAAIATWTRRG